MTTPAVSLINVCIKIMTTDNTLQRLLTSDLAGSQKKWWWLLMV